MRQAGAGAARPGAPGRICRLAAVLAVGLCGAAAAQERRLLEADEAQAFRAVGRLNIAGSRFCTATLVAPDQVLTAAHCLFHPRTKRPVPMGELKFVPAQRIEDNAGVWTVARTAIGTGFAPGDAPAPAELRADVALLELERPVPADAATPFAVGPLSPTDPPTSIVSYARDRSQAPSINDSCDAIGAFDEVLVLDCVVERGVSGAPVLLGRGDAARLVAVVSAMGRQPDGGQFALAVLTEPWLAGLRADLAAEAEGGAGLGEGDAEGDGAAESDADAEN